MWLFNLEKDQLIGYIEKPYQNRSKWIFCATYILYWALNGCMIIFQRPHLITSLFSYQTLGVIGGIYLLIMLSQLVLMKNRLTKVNQVVPEEEMQKIFSKSPSHTIQTPVMSLQTARRGARLVPVSSIYQRTYIKQLLLSITIMLLHALLFTQFIGNYMILDPVFSLHIPLLMLLLSSTLVNLFTAITFFNLILNLTFSYSMFIHFYEAYHYNNLLWNYMANFTELYIITLNLSFIVSSCIGIFFIYDITSQILFYTYLSIFCIYLLKYLVHKLRNINEI